MYLKHGHSESSINVVWRVFDKGFMPLRQDLRVGLHNAQSIFEGINLESPCQGKGCHTWRFISNYDH